MSHENFLPALPACDVLRELPTDKLRRLDTLAALAKALYPTGTIGDAVLGFDYATEHNRFMRIFPEPPHPVPGYQSAPYVSPREKARQALMRKVRDSQEELQIKQLQRELYELQLLAHTCEICYFAFNKKKEDGSIEVKAIKSTRVCSAVIGDPNCEAPESGQCC